MLIMSANEPECEYYIDSLDVPDEVKVEEEFEVGVTVCCRGCTVECPQGEYVLSVTEMLSGPANNYSFPLGSKVADAVSDRTSRLKRVALNLMGGTCTSEQTGFGPMAVDEPGVHKVKAAVNYEGKTAAKTSKVKVVPKDGSGDEMSSAFN